MLDLSTIRGLLIDIDGTLLRGRLPLPGMREIFTFCREHKIKTCITSNNSVTTTEQMQQRFARMGVELEENEIVTSSVATCHYLRRNFPQGGLAYVIGQQGIFTAVNKAGLEIVDNGHQPVDVVVVGGDYQLTYEKLKNACLHIRRGAMFIGTNPDVVYPAEEGFLPETGTTLAALRAATGVEPMVIGKPEKYLFESALLQLQLPVGEIAMLGDRLDTDVLGAKRIGMAAILVETGIDNEASAQASETVPDLIVKDLPDLMERWQAFF